MAPITASAPCTMAMTNATAMSPVRERASTTTTLASANERLLLAAYIALTRASPDDDSAATEKPTLVNTLPMVTTHKAKTNAPSYDGSPVGTKLPGLAHAFF